MKTHLKALGILLLLVIGAAIAVGIALVTKGWVMILVFLGLLYFAIYNSVKEDP